MTDPLVQPRPDGQNPADYTDDVVSADLVRLVRDLGPGGRLPGERDLAIQLGVSRTALRDRLQLLDGLGVLRRTTGSGTYVQTLQPTGLALALNVAISVSQLSTEALHSVRIALERQAAAEAALAGDYVLMAYMRKAIHTIDVASDDADVDDADFHFHDALLRAAGNPALSFFADALSGVLKRALSQRRAEMRLHVGDHEVMVNVHQAIYEAVLSGDPAAAMAATDNHFETFEHFAGGGHYRTALPPRGR
ncbi:MAG: FadR/GntR family transcriptional regulator [Geodermatophilaceae bacterium]